MRADELLEERTLPYDEEAVERAAAPLAGGALLLRGGSDRLWSLSPSGRARDRLPGGGAGAGAAAAGRSGQDRPAGRAQARAPARRRACSSRSTCLRRSWRRPAISCAPARTRASIGCATGTAVEVLPAPRAAAALGIAGVSLAASGSPSSASSSPPEQQTFDTYLHARRPRRPPDRGARARDPRRRPSRGRGASSWPACAACAASTR